MIYLLTLVVLALLLILNHKQLGLAMILAVATTHISQMVVPQLSKLLQPSGSSQAYLTATIRILLVIVPALILIYRSNKRSRSIFKIVFEVTIFGLLLLALIGGDINSLIKLDDLSMAIFKISKQYQQFILVLAVTVGFWQVVVRDE